MEISIHYNNATHRFAKPVRHGDDLAALIAAILEHAKHHGAIDFGHGEVFLDETEVVSATIAPDEAKWLAVYVVAAAMTEGDPTGYLDLDGARDGLTMDGQPYVSPGTLTETERVDFTGRADMSVTRVRTSTGKALWVLTGSASDYIERGDNSPDLTVEESREVAARFGGVIWCNDANKWIGETPDQDQE